MQIQIVMSTMNRQSIEGATRFIVKSYNLLYVL